MARLLQPDTLYLSAYLPIAVLLLPIVLQESE